MAKTVTLITPGSKAHYSSTNIDTNFTDLNTNFVNFLHLGGSGESSNSVLGDVDWGTFKITNLGSPSLDSDAATKGYVDSKTLIAATGTIVSGLVEDADNDTGVQTEATSDNDRLDLFAAVSGGQDNAIEILGNDASASALTNPSIKILKHIFLDTGVRIGDAVNPNTYIELTRSGGADIIFLTAGGSDILQLNATKILTLQNIVLYDNSATAVGKSIGDEDRDTYIQFNKATGGTDDDTIRFICSGSEVVTFTSSAVTFSGASFSIDDLLLGSALVPGDGEDNYIIFPTGTTVTAASSLKDNTVLIYSTAVSGIENDLRFDFKTAVSKATVVLGEDCVFPNNITAANNITLSGSILGTYTIGGTPTLNTALIFGGSGSLVAPVLSGTTTGTYTLGGTPTILAPAVTGKIEVTDALNENVARIHSTHATFTDAALLVDVDRATTSSFDLLRMRTDVGSGAVERFVVDGLGNLQILSGKIEVTHPLNEDTVRFQSTHASFTSNALLVDVNRAAGGGFTLLNLRTDVGTGAVERFKVGSEGNLRIANTRRFQYILSRKSRGEGKVCSYAFLCWLVLGKIRQTK